MHAAELPEHRVRMLRRNCPMAETTPRQVLLRMLPSSVAAARATDALLVLRFRPGQFVLRGEPLAAIVPADNAGAFKAVISRAIHIGSHRTLTQDSEFGIAQVVEIAIRALSPAVNDTFTGVACVDWLADALLTLAERPPLEGNWYDTGSQLRVWMPPVRLERLAKLAFD